MNWIIDEQTKNGTLILRGELTIGHVAEMRDELLTAMQTVHKIGVDIQAVTEIDTSVLQLFCSAHKTSIKMEKLFELIDSPTEVAKNTAGLNGFLRQHGCDADKNQTCLWGSKR